MRMAWGRQDVGNRGTLRVKVYPGPALVRRGLLRVVAKVCRCSRVKERNSEGGEIVS